MSRKAFDVLGINSTEAFVSYDRRCHAEEAAEAYSTVSTREGVRVHPQPTTDPLDPLNWTSFRKHTILALVMWLYFMFTYITTTTIPSFPQIQKLYNISYSEVNWTVGAPSFGLALGPLIWSSLSDIYGRRLVFIAGTTIAFVATIGTALSPSYATYMTSRFFQGLGASPGGTVGMAIINDLFFEHERGQKLGLWVLAINSGIFVGPIVGGVFDMINQFWVDWMTAIFFGMLLVLELAFLPETLYPRKYMLDLAKNFPKENESVRKFRNSLIEHIEQPFEQPLEPRRTTNLFFINFRPLPGMQHPKPWDSLLRFGLTFRFPVVVLATGIFCFSWYWWVISIVTFIPAAYAEYSSTVQGLLFLGLLFGSWFAELLCSGTLSDWIVETLSKWNGGVRVPEARLWLAYPAALLSASGLLLWGISIDQNYHWIVGQIAFFLFAMGLQMGNTVIPSYLIDCYPLQSMSVITFYSVFLDTSAFINPFFIASWVASSGYTTTFAVQGIITFVVAVPVIAFVHKCGPQLRDRSGDPDWVNPEYDVL